MPQRIPNPSSPIGVIAMTMGGPSKGEEVQPFLQALFADPELIRIPVGPLRPSFAWLVSHLRAPGARRRYAAIGGSPLVTESLAQVEALQETLAEVTGWPVRLAVAYGPRGPSSAAALDALVARGVTRVLALPLYPQRSFSTTGASLRALRAAAREHPTVEIHEVPPYPALHGLVDLLAQRARRLLQSSATRGLPMALLATAHGVPERNVRQGDPYVAQVEQTYETLRRSPHLQGTTSPVELALGYQSRIGPLRWVGPSVESEVRRLAARGVRGVVVVPLSFVCEHLETRYDLDLILRRVAREAGMVAYERVTAPGAAPAFIHSLADHLLATAPTAQ